VHHYISEGLSLSYEMHQIVSQPGAVFPLAGALQNLFGAFSLLGRAH